MQPRRVKPANISEPARPDLYKILEANLDKQIHPDDAKSLTVKEQLKRNEHTRLFDNLGDLLDPVFDEFYKVDSETLLEIIKHIRTQGSSNDYMIQDRFSAEEIKNWCKTIMHRASTSLFMNSNNAISPVKKRTILSKTSDELSSVNLLAAYFSAFMQHLLVRINDNQLIPETLQDSYQAFIAFISKNRGQSESNSSKWAQEVLAERRDPELIRRPKPPASRQQQHDDGFSGGEIAAMVATGVGIFAAIVGGLALVATAKKPGPRPSNNNNNNNSPDVSPDWSGANFRKH